MHNLIPSSLHHSDGSFDINRGLRIARQLLLDVNTMGLPCAIEFLDTLSPKYIADLITWGAIGARTTESQLHRELVSGLDCPVGFKNSTDGSVKVAIDAMRAGGSGHSFLGMNDHGVATIIHTAGTLVVSGKMWWWNASNKHNLYNNFQTEIR